MCHKCMLQSSQVDQNVSCYSYNFRKDVCKERPKSIYFLLHICPSTMNFVNNDWVSRSADKKKERKENREKKKQKKKQQQKKKTVECMSVTPALKGQGGL